MRQPSDLTGFPVNCITVVIAYETQNGIEEVVHTIDGKRSDIVSVQHLVERKADKKKDEKGNVVAFETTGEEILLLKVRYIRGNAS